MPSAHSQSERDSLSRCTERAAIRQQILPGRMYSNCRRRRRLRRPRCPPQAQASPFRRARSLPVLSGKHTTGSPSDLEPLAKPSLRGPVAADRCDRVHSAADLETEGAFWRSRALTDPFNLLTIAAYSGISVAIDPHSVYGPGFAGWGRLAGYSFAEDAQGLFTGVYVLPSVFHEDPRYHRMPKATVRRRIAHALIHTLVSQHDDGSLMPNYATLINIPLSAEISNLYVPGIGTNAPDTAKRVLVGYATDPIGPLVAEFLPDFARHFHIRIVFTQQILNRIALGSGTPSSP